MVDEIEDIPVATTDTAELGAESAPVVDTSSETPAEVAATQVNLAPADEGLKQNAQQKYEEQYNPESVVESGIAPLTEAGRAAKENAKEKKQADFADHMQQMDAERQARRKDWLEQDHDFGGTKMSGHDLAKLLDFISNPQMQDKLRERLGKSGMPKEKIDKGMKELNEYIDLKKKEQDGQKLTDEQYRRLKELEKSEEFRAVAAAVQKEYKSSLQDKLTTENSERLVAKTDVSVVARCKDFEAEESVEEPSKTNASSKVVYFESYAPSAIKTGLSSQAEFNEKSIGKSVDVAPQSQKMAMALATPVPTSGLGI